MQTFLNFHTHRAEVSPSETVIRNLPCHFAGNRDEDGCDVRWFSSGIHPWYVPEDYERALTELSACVQSPHCVTLGEAGLDKCCDTPFPLQQEVFLRQLEMAGSFGLPVTVHCVRAWGELLEVRKKSHSPAPCVIHGFRGGPVLARQLLDKGFYLSFGFRFNGQSLQLCPSDRLFLETDEDIRSVEELYLEVSRLRGCTVKELGRRCLENLHHISPLRFAGM